MMVVPFSDILGNVLQRMDSIRHQAGNGGPGQTEVMTHPDGSFEVQIELSEPDEDDRVVQRFGGKGSGGNFGGKGGIIHNMFERMRAMRQNMEQQMQMPMSPPRDMRPRDAMAIDMHKEHDGPMSASPAAGFLQGLMHKKMHHFAKKLNLHSTCEDEIRSCPEHDDHQMINCLRKKKDDLSSDCLSSVEKMEKEHQRAMTQVNLHHAHITERMQRVCEDELTKLCPKTNSVQQLMGTSMQNQALLDKKLVCLVKHLKQIAPDSRCNPLVQRVAQKWGRYEVKQAKSEQLRSELKENCGRITPCAAVRCPFRQLKCLTKQPDLSNQCQHFVQAKAQMMDAEKAQHKQLKHAHKQCKEAFKHAKKYCHKQFSEDDDDEEVVFEECVEKAKQERSRCHQAADGRLSGQLMQPPAEEDDSSDEEMTEKKQLDAQAAAAQTSPEPAVKGTTSFVHFIVSSPGDHCLEVKVPGGVESPFWKDEGWKYDGSTRPGWVSGPCDHTKWNALDSGPDVLDGYDATKNSPYDAVTLTKLGIKQAVLPVPAQAASTQAKPTATATATSVFTQANIPEFDTSLTIALVALFASILAGCVYLLVSRRSSQYTLEAMHMKLVNEARSSHDQL